ncbi:MAG: beta-lactamase family protein [Gemmatimonadetes bacterium]|nr:beta-lactamase family protein [Gemmatimonadota bacterium]
MRLTRRCTALFAALASFSLVAGPASPPLSAQPPASASASGATGRLAPATAAAIDSLYLQMSHSGEPGCAAGVYQSGAITFARGYGFANLTHDVPITPTTRFTTGSVSKQFTAASIALLVRAGRLSLDDDVRKYIPEMNAYPTPVRVRHLVHHTSGLRDFWELVGLAGVRYDDGYTSDDMLAMAARQKGLNFPPGSQYRYSNTGYLAMAVIVQRITGQSLRRFADSAIFKPLGMRETLFLDDHNEIVPRDVRWPTRRAAPGGGSTSGTTTSWGRAASSPRSPTCRSGTRISTPARSGDASSSS